MDFMRKVFALHVPREKPAYGIVIAAVYVLVGFMVALLIFPSQLSLATVTFSTLFLLPYVYKSFEKKSFFSKRHERGFLGIFREHRNTIMFFVFIFLGMVLEYAMLFAFIEPEIGNYAFSEQMSTIIPGPVGSYYAPAEAFLAIIGNNMRLVLISFILSVLYGSGAIFILNFNASIVGMLYGSSIRSLVWSWYSPVFASILLYLPHTIVEVFAYLLAAIAGSILMKAMIQKKSAYMRDAVVILAISVALVFAAGALEVTVPFIPLLSSGA